MNPAIAEAAFKKLCKSEPRLVALRNDLKKAAQQYRKPFCANAVWYGYGRARSFRKELPRLVGDSRRTDPLLGTSDAYDIASDALYNSLPDCENNCACSRFMQAMVTG